MDDDSTEGLNNVVKGPWKSKKIKALSKEAKQISENMIFIEDVTESIMIPLIHQLSENGVDIQNDDLVGEIGFLNEVVKSMLYRHLGYGHPMTKFIEHTMSIKVEESKDTFARLDIDFLDRILDDIKDNEDEPA